jgi:hypothetical protein
MFHLPFKDARVSVFWLVDRLRLPLSLLTLLSARWWTLSSDPTSGLYPYICSGTFGWRETLPLPMLLLLMLRLPPVALERSRWKNLPCKEVRPVDGWPLLSTRPLLVVSGRRKGNELSRKMLLKGDDDNVEAVAMAAVFCRPSTSNMSDMSATMAESGLESSSTVAGGGGD